jgi:putative aldouronate transport system permease protein
MSDKSIVKTAPLGVLRRSPYRRRPTLLLMAVPGILLYVVFRYVPMLGIFIGFQDFSPFSGISAFVTSPFVGLKWFVILFQQPKFFQLLANSLILGAYGIIFAFPAAIILALMVNEVRWSPFKKTTQIITYIPHFLSWAVVGSIVLEILSTDGGIVNLFFGLFGAKPYYFVGDTHLIRGIVVGAGIWKEVGWDSILYLAAMAGIDTALYEAASMDGAGRWKQALHITLPSIMPVIVVCLILSIGRIMETSFDQIWMFYSPKVDAVIDVFDTYSYRVGIGSAQFSYVTALGLFRNIVGLVLVVGANAFSRRVSEHGVW